MSYDFYRDALPEIGIHSLDDIEGVYLDEKFIEDEATLYGGEYVDVHWKDGHALCCQYAQQENGSHRWRVIFNSRV